MKPLRAGIVGVGTISAIYMKNLTGLFSNRVELLGCADLVPERAGAAADEYRLPRRYASPEDLFNDPDIDLVINLTIPTAHFSVNSAAVKADKHCYVEKPLCLTVAQAKDLLALARTRGVRIGGAPDTFLGAGNQTCRKLIDDGGIGVPVAATAFMVSHGHESWHPNPEFYYKPGGGPMFDMGPYYLSALVNLMGPVLCVTGSTRVTFPDRTITSEPKRGSKITVEVPTHVAGTLEFATGAIGTIITSFDVWHANLPNIEIYGSEGSLSVPHPNGFGGSVRIKRSNDPEWTEVPLSHGHTSATRGLGVAEMAEAIGQKRPHRASAELCFHVLEIMQGIHMAAESGSRYELKSTVAQPQPLRPDF